MGCWGITAFESDAGLDAAGIIRKHLPQDGKLDLGECIEAIQMAGWSVPDVTEGYSHTGPMVLAEILVKFLDRDIAGLDYEEDWAKNDNKFSAVTSFASSKESIRWLRDYLSDTLNYAKENAGLRAEHAAKECDRQGGWFKKSDWMDWQAHMSELVSRMDALLAFPENPIDLIQLVEQENSPRMGQSF